MYEDNNTRLAIITDVIDGDTFEADVNLGYGVTVNLRFRIFGINTPEVFGIEKEQGLVSKEFVVKQFLNKPVTIVNKGLDSFRRNLADVYFNSNGVQASLGELLCTEGLAEHKAYK
nr:thermonuclease family protein [Clostridium chromiireducens]